MSLDQGSPGGDRMEATKGKRCRRLLGWSAVNPRRTLRRCWSIQQPGCRQGFCTQASDQTAGLEALGRVTTVGLFGAARRPIRLVTPSADAGTSQTLLNGPGECGCARSAAKVWEIGLERRPKNRDRALVSDLGSRRCSVAQGVVAQDVRRLLFFRFFVDNVREWPG